MYLLGQFLPDMHLVRAALTNFYGIGQTTAKRLCARLQMHERTRVRDLTEAQIGALSTYISAPSAVPARAPEVVSTVPSISPDTDAGLIEPLSRKTPPSQRESAFDDPLRSLVLEGDLKRIIRKNIQHHVTIGTYKGKRHAAHLPVHGQRTQSNARTARKLNRIDRRGFATWAGARSSTPATSVSKLVEPLLEQRFGRSSQS